MKEDITKSLNVATMLPLDYKGIVQTLAELMDLGTDSAKAFWYYDGLRVFCVEDRNIYEWKEVQYGEVGLIPSSYAYPPNTIVEDIDYSGKTFNFVIVSNESGAGASSNLFYLEPSVNIEYKENQTPGEALYFGRLDIGSGEEDVALLSTAFASQSNFDILNGSNIGAEIKLYNLTNNKYLGHFTVAVTLFGSYRVLTIIEKGDWDPLGDYNIQEVLINVVAPSPYSIALVGNVVQLKKGTIVIGSIDLGPIITTSATTITSGVLVGGIVTFTLSDASTFDVDFSALLTAETVVKRGSVLSPNGAAVYENLFVNKVVNASFGTGFYAADLTTNYNSGNFVGFPYPSARDYVVCRYESQYYLLIKKSVTGARMFNEPNNVLGMSFFKYNNGTEKNMHKVAYFKILTRKAPLANINSSWYAYPITSEIGTNFPQATLSGTPDETYLLTGTNEANAYPIISLLYKETLPLKKSVVAPYTLTENDNGRVLFVTGVGDITVPQLSFGFECGFVQATSDTNEIQIVAGSGVNINKPSDKTDTINGQWYSVYLIANEEYTFNGLIGTRKGLEYTLLGDLKDA